MLFKLTKSVTNSEDLNASVLQVLSRDGDVVLRTSISDQYGHFLGVCAHSHIGFKVVMEDVFQSCSCNEEASTGELVQVLTIVLFKN